MSGFGNIISSTRSNRMSCNQRISRRFNASGPMLRVYLQPLEQPLTQEDQHERMDRSRSGRHVFCACTRRHRDRSSCRAGHLQKELDTVRFARSIKGPLTAQYRLNAKAGQMMTVDFKSSNASAYFNITAKGADYALFNGSIMGNHFLGPLPADGEYTVQVYLMRNAARRNEVANYNLSLSLSSGDATDSNQPFDQTLELQGIGFHVTSVSVDGNRALRIAPKVWKSITQRSYAPSPAPSSEQRSPTLIAMALQRFTYSSGHRGAGCRASSLLTLPTARSR